MARKLLKPEEIIHMLREAEVLLAQGKTAINNYKSHLDRWKTHILNGSNYGDTVTTRYSPRFLSGTPPFILQTPFAR